MNFQEKLAQDLKKYEQDNSSNEDRDYPEKHLRHPKLDFRDANEYILRILPPVSPDKEFSVGFRSIFLQATTSKGNPLGVRFTLPEVPNHNSAFEKAINEWSANGTLPNRYQSGPQKRFLLNAVLLSKTNDGIIPEKDNKGNLMVRVLDIPISAYRTILTKLGDPMLFPQQPNVSPEIAQYGFISETLAYPIRITKAKKGQTEYPVEVYTNIPLGPLPQNWRDFTEDLQYQATPNEEHSPEFVTDFIEMVYASQGGHAPSQNQGNQGFQQQTQSSQGNQGNQGFNQPAQQSQQSQPNQGSQQPVQPQQPSQSFSQPTQPNQSFNQGNQGNQGSQQPAQPQQPQQPSQSFSQDDPLAGQGSAIAGQGNQGSQQPVQPQQPSQSQPAPTGNPQGNTSIPDIDDLIKGMQ